MEIVDELKKYRSILAEIRAIDLEIQELSDEDSIRAISPVYDERTSPTHKFNSIVENQVIAKEDKIKGLEYEKRCKERQLARIDNALSVLNENEKKVIELKHLKGLKWESIVYSLDRTYQQCKRIESQAIKKIKPLLIN